MKIQNKIISHLKTMCYLLCLAYSCVGCSKDMQKPAENKKFKILEDLVIGNNESMPPEYLFGRPRNIFTDTKQNIFVPEETEMAIRVYDKKGNYIRTIGKRGKGPGEFSNISCISINSGDTIIVFDMFNLRISYLNTNGEFLGSKRLKLEKVLWPRNMRELKNHSLLLSYMLPQGSDVLHLLSNDLKTKLLDFGKELLYKEDVVSKTVAGIEGCNIAVNISGEVYCVPYLYNGEIFKYSLNEHELKKRMNLEGYVVKKEPYTFIEEPTEATSEKKNWSVKGFSSGQKFAANYHNESRGLFVLNNGMIVHFTLIEDHGSRIFGVELYGKNGNLISYNPIKKIKHQTDEAADIPIYVDWKDNEDNFYIRDKSEYPVIKRVRISL